MDDKITPETVALAKATAARCAWRWGLTHERDEMTGAALEALVVAARNHDPSRGAQFTTYAAIVVFHAMVKWCRNHNQHVVRQADERHAEELMSDPPIGPHEAAEYGELVLAVESCLRHDMPKELASAVRHCRKVNGSSQLAKAAGISRHGVEYRRDRGRKVLRKDKRIRDYLARGGAS